MKPFILKKENTFCISLENKKERWEKMCKRFEYFDMKVTRWIASTETDLKENFVYYLNVGQRGCAQSHINIWRYMVENELEYAFILEDDACFDKEWKQKLDRFCRENTDEEWDAVLLNVSEPEMKRNTWTIANEQYLSGGYILSIRGAKKMLETFSHCYFSSDWMISRLEQQGHCYTYFPWLIIQEGNESTIGSGYEMDHEKVIRCLKEVAYDIDNYII